MREFTPHRDAICVQASTDIAAPPDQVAAVYRDVERWGEIFPATIERARITGTGDNWQQIEVIHRTEGRVPNTLIFRSENEVVLEESKQRFNAAFVNRFHPVARRGTHYVITAYISLKGMYRVLRPLLAGYVRRQALKQMNLYVLEPLKQAAEKAQEIETGGYPLQ